ncbi:MAG TPA: ATP-binding protein [Firmicutes bacterium]|nr:ATP-binding protein [Bacillota bacterium]
MPPGDGSFAGNAFMFVGRTKELAALRKAASSVSDCQVLNIYGPGGIGKTHLLYRFAEELRAQGACVIWLNAGEIEPSTKGFANALRLSLTRTAAHISPPSVPRAGGTAARGSPPPALPAVPAQAPPEEEEGNLLRKARTAASGTSLQGALGLLNVVADARPTVVVIDDYETSPLLDGLFRRSVLPSLDTRILVVIASWHPLSRLWEGDPASLARTRCLALRCLAPQEAEELLRQRGIAGQGVIDRIILFAGGLPLALVLAANAELDPGAAGPAGAKATRDRSYREISHEVFRRIVREVPDEHVLRLLETACVIRRCNEELLSHLAGTRVTALDISKLTSLSFVHVTEEGLTIDDEIRNVVLEDMRWRAPERLASLRRLAMDWFKKRLGGAGADDSVEYLFLTPDPLLRRYFFTEWDDVGLYRDAGAPKIEELTSVYGEWLRDYLGQKDERPEEIHQISRLFALYPDRFIAVRERDGRLAGFTCLIPVEERSLPVLQASEVTWLCVDHLPGLRSASHILLFPFITRSAHAYQARAALVQAVFEWQAEHEAHAVFVTWVHEETAASRAEKLGFKRLQEPVCTAYGPAMPVSYYCLDLTNRSVQSWLAEMLGQEEAPRATSLSFQEIVQETVFCLRHFWNNEKLELSKMSRLRIVAHRLARTYTPEKAGAATAGERPAAVSDAIRSLLKDAIALLAQGTGRFAFRSGADQARLIRLAYIERAGSHERMMERLGLPRTTYYRRLRRALHNIAAIVASLEQDATGS